LLEFSNSTYQFGNHTTRNAIYDLMRSKQLRVLTLLKKYPYVVSEDNILIISYAAFMHFGLVAPIKSLSIFIFAALCLLAEYESQDQ
jgi:hypothetical protein